MLAIFLSSLIFEDGLLKGVFGDETIEASIFLIESVTILYFLLKIYPEVLFKYVLITNIHMKKDSRSIIKVIDKQKQNRAIVFFRILQSFKQIYWSSVSLSNKKCQKDSILSNLMKNWAKHFENCKVKSMSKIGIDDLNMYFEYCGTNLSSVELEAFIKKARHSGNYIDFKTISKGLIKSSYESQLDPYEVVVFALWSSFKDNNFSSRSEVSISELR